MSQFHGSDGVVKISSAVVAEVKGFTVNETAETFQTNAPTTNDPAPATTHMAGPTSWDATIDCYWDDTDATGQEAMTIGASVTVHLQAEGNTAGDHDLTGTAIVTDIGIPVSFDGVVERSIQLKGSGALTHGTV